MKKTMMSIKIKDKTFSVDFNKKKIKKIIIKINPMNKITVNYPNNCPKETAEKHFLNHLNWIEKTLDIQKERFNGMFIDECFLLKKIWLLGKLYDLKKDETINELYQYLENTIIYKGDIKKAIGSIQVEVLKQISLEFERFSQSFKKHIHQEPYLEFRKMKSRWGSCNYKSGRIALNKCLIHLPIELIRYVIIHEFAHFIHPNHSSGFYLFLKQFIPDYRLCEKELKKFSFYLSF